MYLVGAGPGDPELLTLKALRILQDTEVLLHDDLVSDAVLEYVNPRARVIHVGKRGGCASTPQAFIEKLMIAEARRGNRVTRLKGGDPFLFGRGGEEYDALRAAGIVVEVVPGVSSGFAAAAASGVPLTHRDCGPGVIFVTGHPRQGGPEADWQALANTGFTLVIYMGVAKCADTRASLLAAGMSAETPVVVVHHASGRDERQLVTSLDRLAADLAAAEIASPAIIIVGEVARNSIAERPQRARTPDLPRDRLSC